MNESVKQFLLGMWSMGCIALMYNHNHHLGIALGSITVAIIVTVGILGE